MPPLTSHSCQESNGWCFFARLALGWLTVLFAQAAFGQAGYQVKPSHPRLLIDDVAVMTAPCQGPLRLDYEIVKERADAAVRHGQIESIANPWSAPEDLMNCGLAYLIERQQGHDSRKYAELIIKQFGDGRMISNPQGSHFGYCALVYDWIYDALTPEQRILYGDALGSWLRFFTDKPEILLKWGDWGYNQTWGPIHMNIMNSRDSLTQKLLIALAITGSGTRCEPDAHAFLDSWNKRVPAECIPAFNRMGGVWSESYGHGGYGPVTVIPYAFRAWRTATGIDLLRSVKPWGYPVEEPRWVAYTMMPHDNRTAWIDDGDGSKPSPLPAPRRCWEMASRNGSRTAARNGCTNVGNAWPVMTRPLPPPRRHDCPWAIFLPERVTCTCAAPGTIPTRLGLSSAADRNLPATRTMTRDIF